MVASPFLISLILFVSVSMLLCCCVGLKSVYQSCPVCICLLLCWSRVTCISVIVYHHVAVIRFHKVLYIFRFSMSFLTSIGSLGHFAHFCASYNRVVCESQPATPVLTTASQTATATSPPPDRIRTVNTGVNK